MNYIILDLEWNQCPYGKKKEDPKLPFEIIEIGAVKLDASFQEIGCFHETIRPILYRKLHYMTRNVIHMTEQDFEGKRTFPHVFADFLVWCGDSPTFCTWGPGDLTELLRNVRWHIDHGYLTGKWPFPFPFFYRDVQKIFSIVYEDGKKRRSLEWAVEYLQIEKREEFHDAFSDARYTARILQMLPPGEVRSCSSIDTYHTPSRRSEEILVHYSQYTKFISKSYPDRESVMKDRVITSTRCLECDRKIRKTIRWFSDNSRNYLCIAQCPEHGLFRSKIRLRQNPENEWYVVKTTRKATQEDVDAIRKKQETLRHRRRVHRMN